MLKNLTIAIGLVLTTTFSFAQTSKNITFKSQIPYSNTSNIWGYKDTTGKEYALVGAWNNLSIVDVTNPTAPVKRFSVPGPGSAWREIRTLGKYAYVTTEGGGGVTIVDMRSLPDTVYYKNYTGDGAIAGLINQVHALHIDNNKLYLYGGDYQGGRAKIFSLADPWNPVYLGTVTQRYVHDGFVRNDTLYSCQIYAGELVIVDATNPQNPQIINSQLTPGAFTHNSWISTNKKVIYTTDEVEASYVTAYDISNLNDIKELDRYRHNNSGSIAHNTYVLNDSNITGYNTDFLWTSYYTDGITLVDASRPHNLIEIGYYDSNLPAMGPGFQGAWGVYPYLPSGHILVSDISNGMHVVKPTYKKACYIEGTVKNQFTNSLLANANIVIIEDTSKHTMTKLNGSYAFGTADSGTYTIVTSLFGYFNDTTVVTVDNGVLTDLNINLVPMVNFALAEVITDSNMMPIANVDVVFENLTLGNRYELRSNANGEISIPVFYASDYNIIIGKFGYKTQYHANLNVQDQNDLPDFILEKGYYDDFVFNNNWTTVGDVDNGGWVRAVPIKTTSNSVLANPDFDVQNDIGTYAFVTENNAGPATFGDVDNGEVVLTSPIMDLSTYTNPHIHFSRYFSNLSSNSTPNDTLTISISNGTQTKVLEKIWGKRDDNATWVEKTVRLKDVMTPSNNMRIIVKTAETPTDHIVEAGFDKMFVSDSANVINSTNELKSIIDFSVYPNPNSGSSTITYNFIKLNGDASLVCFDILGNKIVEKQLTNAQGQLKLELENKGMYFVKLKNGEDERVIKLIVK